MSGSIFIYNLPTTNEFLTDGFLPITNSELTRKISGPILRNYIDKTVTLSLATSLAADDFIKVDSVSLGTRKVAVKNSVFYPVASGLTAGPSELVKGNDTRLTDARTPVAHTHPVSDIFDFNPLHYVSTSSVGQANGVAPLGNDGLIPTQFIPPDPPLSIAANTVSSTTANLVTGTNVQLAINQLSSAQNISVDAAAVNVVGTNNVQGALSQKLSLTGGTLTGNLNVPSNGLRVGTNDITVSSNRVGIGVNSATAKLDVDGDSVFRNIIHIRNGGYGAQITFSDFGGASRRFGIWRDPSDILVIGPQSDGNDGNAVGFGYAAIGIYRDRGILIHEKLTIPSNKAIQFGAEDENSDRIQIARVNVDVNGNNVGNTFTNRSELRVMIGDDPVGGSDIIDKFVIGTKNNNAVTTPSDIVDNFRPVFAVNSNGSISGVQEITDIVRRRIVSNALAATNPSADEFTSSIPIPLDIRGRVFSVDVYAYNPSYANGARFKLSYGYSDNFTVWFTTSRAGITDRGGGLNDRNVYQVGIASNSTHYTNIPASDYLYDSNYASTQNISTAPNSGWMFDFVFFYN